VEQGGEWVTRTMEKSGGIRARGEEEVSGLSVITAIVQFCAGCAVRLRSRRVAADGAFAAVGGCG
jgi:hypothetical protein